MEGAGASDAGAAVQRHSLTQHTRGGREGGWQGLIACSAPQ